MDSNDIRVADARESLGVASTARRTERRLTQRVLDLWREVRGDSFLTSPREFEPGQLGVYWPHCFLLRLDGGPEPILDRCGDSLLEDCGVPVLARPISCIPAESLLGMAVGGWLDAVSRRVPIVRGSQAPIAEGPWVHMRSVLIPLSATPTRITHVLGAANGRKRE